MSNRLKQSLPEHMHRLVSLLRSNPLAHDKVTSTYVRATPLTAAQQRAQDFEYEQSVAAARMADPTAPPPPRPRAPRRTALEVEPGWSVQNHMLCHVLLLDREGRVRWRAVGPPQGEDEEIMQRVLQQIIEEDEGKPQTLGKSAAARKN